MSEEISLELDIDDMNLEFEIAVGEEMTEKFKREVNTMLYANDFYCFGFSLDIGLTELACASKGVVSK